MNNWLNYRLILNINEFKINIMYLFYIPLPLVVFSFTSAIEQGIIYSPGPGVISLGSFILFVLENLFSYLSLLESFVFRFINVI